MRLVLHIGAHGTDGGQIARWIGLNRSALEADGMAVPPPGLFLRRLTEVLDRDRNADPLAREEALLRSLGASGQRRRIIVSAPGLLGGMGDVFSEDGFYRRDLARRLHAMSLLFPRTQLSLLLAVRSAQGLVPQVMPAEPGAAEAMLPLIPETSLPWSSLAGAIRQHLPKAELRVWRHEDLPQVWPSVLAAIIGPECALPPKGLLEFAQMGLGAEAQQRMRDYLTKAEVKPTSAGQLRRIAEAFARRFGAAAEADPAADLPGWLRTRLAAMDEGYAAEWADLCAVEGIRSLTPR